MARISGSRGRAAVDFRALPPAERQRRVKDALTERKLFDFLVGASNVQEEKESGGQLVVPA
jgi:hypothetical protein